MLANQDKLKGRVLDYGCGRGKDADTYGMEKYDPYFFPALPDGKFNTILCSYVLNVVSKQDEKRVIRKVLSLLEPGGCAYFTVRRDVKEDGITSKGTYQRDVVLNFKSVAKKNGKFEIYQKCV